MSPAYLPQLDGIRAVAIIAVVLFHIDHRVFSVGWTGVVMFFVLSGYLITGILLDAKGSPNFFRAFYARRALRIFPAYFLLLGMTFLLILWMTPRSVALGPVLSEWKYYVLYVQNYWLGLQGFKTALAPSLAHTWTLAVEEQFYLLWPLIVYFTGRRGLALLCVVLFIASPLVRLAILVGYDNPYLALTALPAQCDGLALGALLAVGVRLPGSTSRWLLNHSSRHDFAIICTVLAMLTLLVLRTGWESYAAPTVWQNRPGNGLFVSMVGLLSGALIVAAINRNSPIARMLAWRPLAHIGRISYGLYLYHISVFGLSFIVLSRVGPQLQAIVGDGLGYTLSAASVKVIALYLLALLSYYGFERYFLRLKARFSTAHEPSAAIATV